MRVLLQLASGLVLACLSSSALTQPLRDPTRPPGDAVSTPSVSKPRPRQGMILQTVVISPDRRTAVISGRVMSVGDSLYGYRLAEIREGAVVMRGSKGTRTLRLFPGVSKVASTAATETEGKKGPE